MDPSRPRSAHSQRSAHSSHRRSQTGTPAPAATQQEQDQDHAADPHHHQQQQQQQQQQQHHADLAFLDALASEPGTNEWGKRPAEADAADSEANKRPHLEGDAAAAQIDYDVLASFPPGTDEVLARELAKHLPAQQEAEGEARDESGSTASEGDDVQDGSYEPGVLQEDSDHDDDDYVEEGVGEQWHSGMNMDPSAYLLWDANQQMRVHSLPILDNLSTQILTTLGKGPYQETLNIVTQPDSDQGQAYNTMKSLFDQTKRLYTAEAFLSADELKFYEAKQRATIRKVNLATFVSSVFGSQEVGFFHLNEHFLDTFVPDGAKLLKSQGQLYLDLKTQAYISAMSTNERAKEEILDDLFPTPMQEILLDRRSGAKGLTPSETDFCNRLSQRKLHLKTLPDDENLAEKYIWQDFLKEVSGYVSRHYQAIISNIPQVRPQSPLSYDPYTDYEEDQSLHTRTSPRKRTSTSRPVPKERSASPDQDAATAAALEAHFGAPQQPIDQAALQAQTKLNAQLYGADTSGSYMGAPPLAPAPHAEQSAPTAVLYERARLAATSKSSTSTRRAGLPSQRRPWTTDEENALMAGLDRVKGPHWSQILAMFGPGGKINETLKDRNQVQLKDKARNLKLFFLKSGIEVPYYLKFVTGELKTRAPAQAAKAAAKQKGEEKAEEDKAHVEAVQALAKAKEDGDEMEGVQGDQDGQQGEQMQQGEGQGEQAEQQAEQLTEQQADIEQPVEAEKQAEAEQRVEAEQPEAEQETEQQPEEQEQPEEQPQEDEIAEEDAEGEMDIDEQPSIQFEQEQHHQAPIAPMSMMQQQQPASPPQSAPIAPMMGIRAPAEPEIDADADEDADAEADPDVEMTQVEEKEVTIAAAGEEGQMEVTSVVMEQQAVSAVRGT